MQTLEIKKRKINFNDFRNRAAMVGDCEQFVSGDFRVFCEGKLICSYKSPRVDWSPLISALESIKFSAADRTGGLISNSRVFGYQPRNAIRRDFCGAASLKREGKKQHDIIEEYGDVVSECYSAEASELHAAHAAITKEKVKPEYTIGKGPFTSGIANKNNPLRYHYDKGNYKNVWSAMIVIKRDILGGHLSMPELGICAEIAHGGVFLFDGQSILHGVTPITKLSEDSMRYTVVYYSMFGMWKCLPMNDEVARIRERRTQIQNRRMAPPPEKGVKSV